MTVGNLMQLIVDDGEKLLEGIGIASSPLPQKVCDGMGI
jgi:hypothetical protein